MARTKRSAKLDTRNARLKLEAGKMHQEPLAPAQYLAYRRPEKGGAGSWLARQNRGGKIIQSRLGTADDFQDSDGAGILTYGQGQAKAGEWFKAQDESARVEAGGEVVNQGPYTVADALRNYFEDGERRGMKGLSRDEQRASAWITPDLGSLEVSALTRHRIETWLAKVADSPRRLRTKKGAKQQALAPAPKNEDEKRARKDSANRCLTVLKAALNHALDRGKVHGGDAWKAVKAYRETTSARVRFLSPADQVRLVNASTLEFQELVRGALLTGARYGELARLRVEDFNGQAGTVFIAESKSGKPRHVVLTDEGKALFEGMTAGRKVGEVVFIQPDKKRRKRESMGISWGANDARRLMAQACKDAKLEPLTFHELRHSYASMLVNAGCPLAYVAAQLGHSDTRMVEKHYGHLAPSAMADAIRAALPALGLVDLPKVAGLRIQGA